MMRFKDLIFRDFGTAFVARAEFSPYFVQVSSSVSGPGWDAFVGEELETGEIHTLVRDGWGDLQGLNTNEINDVLQRVSNMADMSRRACKKRPGHKKVA